MVDALAAQHPTDKGDIADDVRRTVAKLAELGLVVDVGTGRTGRTLTSCRAGACWGGLTMPIAHFTSSVEPQTVAAAISSDGAVIVDAVAPRRCWSASRPSSVLTSTPLRPAPTTSAVTGPGAPAP